MVPIDPIDQGVADLVRSVFRQEVPGGATHIHDREGVEVTAHECQNGGGHQDPGLTVHDQLGYRGGHEEDELELAGIARRTPHRSAGLRCARYAIRRTNRRAGSGSF